MKQKHLVLGPGIIGEEVFQYLKQNDFNCLFAGRSEKQQEDYLQIDASNKDQLVEKTVGISHLYVTIGVAYNRKKWRKEWPVITSNIIAAAKLNQFRIIFFDNVYAYGLFENPATESHPLNPNSHKGETRKMVDEMLLDAMDDVDIMIVKSPDFFGPLATSSVFYISFLENMLKGKKPMFIGSPNKQHSYSYTKDLAQAMVTLALAEDAYHQVWHLPCYQTAGIHEVLEISNKVLKTDFEMGYMSPFAVTLLSIFIPILKEVGEMRYQFDHDYVLDDSKFMERFPDFKKTDFKQAIKETIQAFQ